MITRHRVNEMNTCDTCKHWGPNQGDQSRKIDHPLTGACHNSNVVGDSIEMVADNPSFACIDVEEAVFVTGPKFGCVNWEAK
jgi:hypothetical protein